MCWGFEWAKDEPSVWKCTGSSDCWHGARTFVVESDVRGVWLSTISRDNVHTMAIASVAATAAIRCHIWRFVGRSETGPL